MQFSGVHVLDGGRKRSGNDSAPKMKCYYYWDIGFMRLFVIVSLSQSCTAASIGHYDSV